MISGRTIFSSEKISVYLQSLILLWILIFQAAQLCASQYWPQAQWRNASPESQGMSSRTLSELLYAVEKNDYEIDSIIIVRNGYVVLESYTQLQEPHFRHHIHSCTKSVVSALIGIAIDEGYIESVDQSVLELFPEKSPQIQNSDKEKITLRHLLMMATGLACEDSVRYELKGLKEMWQSDDWVQYMIDLPLVEPPGTRFEYCNGASALLTAIIQKTTGTSAFEFARRHLFSPLQIEDVHWKSHHGITIGYSNLTMRPLDMARFGYLFLHDGRWNNHEIISDEWVKESTTKLIGTTLHDGYGYQWWVMAPDRYGARGAHGQRIFVLKDKDMVVVFMGNLKESKTLIPEALLQNFIIPAIRADKPLPENPRSWERLKSMQLSGQNSR
ncbi:MAG: beta-lactamase family protein [Desulfofustis sp.]|nr:beta-lactamase family protein [Desulfofustis sp.]